MLVEAGLGRLVAILEGIPCDELQSAQFVNLFNKYYPIPPTPRQADSEFNPKLICDLLKRNGFLVLLQTAGPFLRNFMSEAEYPHRTKELISRLTALDDPELVCQLVTRLLSTGSKIAH